VFAGGGNGDADRVSAPHRNGKHSNSRTPEQSTLLVGRPPR
jgi:hypothetical protein